LTYFHYEYEKRNVENVLNFRGFFPSFCYRFIWEKSNQLFTINVSNHILFMLIHFEIMRVYVLHFLYGITIFQCECCISGWQHRYSGLDRFDRRKRVFVKITSLLLRFWRYVVAFTFLIINGLTTLSVCDWGNIPSCSTLSSVLVFDVSSLVWMLPWKKRWCESFNYVGGYFPRGLKESLTWYQHKLKCVDVCRNYKKLSVVQILATGSSQGKNWEFLWGYQKNKSLEQTINSLQNVALMKLVHTYHSSMFVSKPDQNSIQYSFVVRK